MRHGEITIEYVGASDIISASRIGLDLVYAMRPEKMDPPTLVEDSTTQYSLRGQRKATTVHGDHYEGLIEVSRLSGDRQPLHAEFIDSVKGEAPFIIHAEYWPGIMRAMDAFVPAKQYKQEAVRQIDRYTVSVPYRTIGEVSAAPPAISAGMLTPGVTITGSYGAGTVTVPVTRYAYFMFTGTTSARTLTFTITSAHDIMCRINGRPYGRHRGTATVVILQIPADGQMTGTNSVRFESESLSADWSISNVVIS
jgi:hypothetical protein